MEKIIIIGPCALESIEQVKPIAEVAHKQGIKYFRANIFKPRTNPNSFQGLGLKGLPVIEYLHKQGFKLVTEACSLGQLDIVKDFASMIQIGTRNMQNFELLKAMGRTVDFSSGRYQVMLKRGFANNMAEWLSSAEYLEQSGVPRDKIILCERGSRNHAAPSGVTLDLALAYKVKMETNYKVIVDPSHGTRESSLVLPLAKAALAMDFDGLMIETHPKPLESMSDPQQAVRPNAIDSFFTENLSFLIDKGISASNNSTQYYS